MSILKSRISLWKVLYERFYDPIRLLMCFALFMVIFGILSCVSYKIREASLNKGGGREKYYDYHEYRAYKVQYKWLTEEIFRIVWDEAVERGLERRAIFAIIQAESGGRNVVSRRNRNGTRDYGLMQINSVHSPKNPWVLLNVRVNVRTGCWYFSRCIKKSGGVLSEAVRYYNAGLGSKRKSYKNWRHVYRVVAHYKRSANYLGRIAIGVEREKTYHFSFVSSGSFKASVCRIRNTQELRSTMGQNPALAVWHPVIDVHNAVVDEISERERGLQALGYRTRDGNIFGYYERVS